MSNYSAVEQARADIDKAVAGARELFGKLEFDIDCKIADKAMRFGLLRGTRMDLLMDLDCIRKAYDVPLVCFRQLLNFADGKFFKFSMDILMLQRFLDRDKNEFVEGYIPHFLEGYATEMRFYSGRKLVGIFHVLRILDGYKAARRLGICWGKVQIKPPEWASYYLTVKAVHEAYPELAEVSHEV